MQHLKAIIRKYIQYHIPFALFRYPNKAINLIAQYSFSQPVENLSPLKKGFLIHPFMPDEYCSIRYIKPDIYTSNFESILLSDIVDLGKQRNKVCNETCIDQTTYMAHLKRYQHLIQQSILQKAIYSRIKAFNPIPVNNLVKTFLTLEKTYPNAFCYLFQLPDNGIWLGASPERLLSYQNGIAKTVALAGTKNIKQKKTAWGDKEKEEQALVSIFIKGLLKQFNLKQRSQSKTETIEAGSLQHLKTAFEFNLSTNQLTNFLKALHPTPAVGGYPQKEAIDCILKTEIHHRQYYTGYLGFINELDDLDLYVNLRCAKITNQHTLAFVGGGITKDSDPALEWQETEHKSETIGNVLMRNY